jgi:hypothetical protein
MRPLGMYPRGFNLLNIILKWRILNACSWNSAIGNWSILDQIIRSMLPQQYKQKVDPEKINKLEDQGAVKKKSGY